MICIDNPTSSTDKAVDTTITTHEITTGTLLKSHSPSPRLPDLVFSSVNPLGPPDTWKLPSSATVTTEKSVEVSAILNCTEILPHIEATVEPEQIHVHMVHAPSAESAEPAELLGDIKFYDQPMPTTMSMTRHSPSVISVLPKGRLQQQVRTSLPERRRRRRAAMDVALRLWVDG
jgi:hypothetical protein